MRSFFTKLRNMLNAIAYAEAGDLDMAKQIRQAGYNSPRVAEEPEDEGIGSGRPAIPAL